MNVKTRTTFFFGDLKPATSSLSVKYFSTSFMKVLALLLSPLKRGGSLPMALTFAAAATGCAAAPPAAAGPPPPGGPPPLGGPGGDPPVPPPRSPITTFRRSLSSASVRGYCGATAAVDAVWVMVWVCVVVMLVPVMLCDRLLLVIVKNGVCATGVVRARGSFMFMGLFRMVRSNGSCSVL